MSDPSQNGKSFEFTYGERDNGSLPIGWLEGIFAVPRESMMIHDGSEQD